MSSFDLPQLLFDKSGALTPAKFDDGDDLLVTRLGDFVCDTSGHVRILHNVFSYGWSKVLSSFVYLFQPTSPERLRGLIIESESHLRKPAFRPGDLVARRYQDGPSGTWRVKEMWFKDEKFSYTCEPMHEMGDAMIGEEYLQLVSQ